MKMKKAALVAAAACLCLVHAAPVLAQGNSGNAPGRGVPGPLAGAGLPFLAVAAAAGAYRLIRRRRDEGRRPPGEVQRH
jgi:hypothetical protein